eukprot:TRINITY_DN14315_c0_g1_i1.p1 TRINITY_DN14315_c0_g1~~TRINITY_DN14315_c0_g1_i1.p1  ORF type:complete len:233 (-),score=24.48 TRINITY_DN14315_c0_g1_i1:43-741(-)
MNELAPGCWLISILRTIIPFALLPIPSSTRKILLAKMCSLHFKNHQLRTVTQLVLSVPIKKPTSWKEDLSKNVLQHVFVVTFSAHPVYHTQQTANKMFSSQVELTQSQWTQLTGQTVPLSSNLCGKALERTKKEAEKNAAHDLLSKLDAANALASRIPDALKSSGVTTSSRSQTGESVQASNHQYRFISQPHASLFSASPPPSPTQVQQNAKAADDFYCALQKAYSYRPSTG